MDRSVGVIGDGEGVRRARRTDRGLKRGHAIGELKCRDGKCDTGTANGHGCRARIVAGRIALGILGNHLKRYGRARHHARRRALRRGWRGRRKLIRSARLAGPSALTAEDGGAGGSTHTPNWVAAAVDN